MARGSGTGTVLKKCDCKVKRTCPHGWTLRYYLDGKQKEQTFRDTLDGSGKRVYGSGQQLAKDAAAAMFRAKRASDETFADKKLAEVPFLPYCEEWIGRRSPSTRAIYMSTLNRIRKDLAGRTLRQVANDREGAQRLIDAAPESYKLRTRVILVSPLNEAVKAGRITGHRLRGLDVAAETSQRAEFEWASRTQLETMATALGDRGLLVWLGRLAGMRLGEALGLNIADFRENGTVIRLERQRLANGTLGPLKQRKAGEFRDIPCPRALWARVQDAPRDADGFFFNAEWRPTVMAAIKKAQTAAGLPGEFVPHWLRHMYASELLDKLVPITDVSRFLGHKNISVTNAVYGHLAPSSLGRARDVLDAEWAA